MIYNKIDHKYVKWMNKFRFKTISTSFAKWNKWIVFDRVDMLRLFEFFFLAQFKTIVENWCITDGLMHITNLQWISQIYMQLLCKWNWNTNHDRAEYVRRSTIIFDKMLLINMAAYNVHVHRIQRFVVNIVCVCVCDD